MHALTSHFVLGYHGCDRELGEKILEGENFILSKNDYDWLGHGIYFWENNPERALQFAKEKQKRHPDQMKNPFVVGAVLDLGFCLDMSTQNGIDYLKEAHNMFEVIYEQNKLILPENKLGQDFLLRHLDCAVFEYLHSIRKRQELIAFDSVRGVFTEGNKIYNNAGFYEKTHTQIAIRNEFCVKEVFKPRYFKQ